MQSKLLGYRLSKVNFVEILSSDLGRANVTCEEVVGYHSEKQFEYTSQLRERSLGILEGKTEKDVKSLMVKKGIREFRPEGGESLDDLMKRVSEVIEELILKYCKKQNDLSGSFINKNQIYVNNKIKPKKNKTNFIKSPLDSDVPKEYKYLKLPFEELENNFEFKKITKVYQGLDIDLNIPRVLLITHKIFIQELLNMIRGRMKLSFQNYTDTYDTALYIFRIFCPQCVGICYSKNEKCELEYEIILYNDIEHLG
jgi:hypothetical protein